MSTLQITGTVTDADGNQSSFTGQIVVQNAPVVQSVVVTPLSAPAGTLRQIKINATDADGGPLTYTCFVDGQPATQDAADPSLFTFTA